MDHVNANMPSAPAFETAAASSGTADIGAWTIGCSMPSSSQTGVRTITTYLFAPAGRMRHRLDEDPPASPASTCCYDSYDVGIDCFARLFHP